tara:strand:- start:136 stop:342 length:207 start_codon:yes stop_codon:yes gene_type:complete
MRFIQMTDLHGETVAINPLNITSIKILNATVVVLLGADMTNTNFRSVAEATSFIESSSKSLRDKGVGQ